MTEVGGGPGSGVPSGGELPLAAGGPSAADGALELLEAVFDHSAAGLAVVVGPELRFEKVNPAYRALCPDPAVDPVGRRFEEVWPDARDCEALARSALSSGRAAELSEWTFSVGGRVCWLSLNVRPVRWRGDQELLLILWETTALVEARWVAEAAAEEAMRHAAHLEAMASAIADGFAVFGPSGEVLRLNAAAQEIFRRVGLELPLAEAEPAGRIDLRGQVQLRDLEGRPLPPEAWPVTRALAGATVRGAHLRLDRAGFPPLWILVSAAPIRDAEGRSLGAVMNFSDESALHELEEARDDLVRMISHDLRTPLSAVYTQAHLLRRGKDTPEKVVERAHSIERSCERMSGMIQDLVEATLLEAGQLPLARAPVDLAALLPELLERLRGALDVDRVRLELQLPVCWAELDSARMERIVMNLVSNALKYSAAAVTVTLALGERGTVVLSVADRGVGISPEDQAHLFERFFRARGARRPEGLGLGLYITRLLAEAHGGRVEVESQLGQGSTFRVVLPAAVVIEAGHAGDAWA